VLQNMSYVTPSADSARHRRSPSMTSTCQRWLPGSIRVRSGSRTPTIIVRTDEEFLRASFVGRTEPGAPSRIAQTAANVMDGASWAWSSSGQRRASPMSSGSARSVLSTSNRIESLNRVHRVCSVPVLRVGRTDTRLVFCAAA